MPEKVIRFYSTYLHLIICLQDSLQVDFFSLFIIPLYLPTLLTLYPGSISPAAEYWIKSRLCKVSQSCDRHHLRPRPCCQSNSAARGRGRIAGSRLPPPRRSRSYSPSGFERAQCWPSESLLRRSLLDDIQTSQGRLWHQETTTSFRRLTWPQFRDLYLNLTIALI